MSNEYGLDYKYFEEKLSLIVRDASRYTPGEMLRELSKYVEVARCSMKEPPLSVEQQAARIKELEDQLKNVIEEKNNRRNQHQLELSAIKDYFKQQNEALKAENERLKRSTVALLEAAKKVDRDMLQKGPFPLSAHRLKDAIKFGGQAIEQLTDPTMG